MGCPRHVRFTPDSDRIADIATCPKSAKCGSEDVLPLVWDRSSQCARQVQSVHTKASCPASIFQAAKSIAYAPRASSAESDHLHPRHKQTPHRLHQNVTSSIQSS